MKPIFWTLGLAVVVVAAGAVSAVEVPLRDGTVVIADSYTINGSYVVLKLPNGSQLAYDVVDVDLPALRAAEAASAAAAGPAPEPAPRPPDAGMSAGRSLKHSAGSGEPDGSTLTITDRDVKHVRGSGVRGDEEQATAEVETDRTAEEGYRQGGGVVLDKIRIEAAGEGRWQVRGEVINRNPFPALNVIVKLETVAGTLGEPWSGEVPVAAALGPDEKAAFESGFAAEVKEGTRQPGVRASVIWMQEESRRVPDYSGAGGVQHPSNLPLERGGVGGADVRPTPVG